MLAEVDKYIAANGVVLPDPGYNGPAQVLKNNWPILLKQMWSVVAVAVAVLALLVYGAVRIIRRGRSRIQV
jgi:hypothetical protein